MNVWIVVTVRIIKKREGKKVLLLIEGEERCLMRARGHPLPSYTNNRW